MGVFGEIYYAIGKTDGSGREWFVVDNSTMEDFLDDEMKKMVIWGDQIDEYTYLSLQAEQASHLLCKAMESDGADSANATYYIAEVHFQYEIRKKNVEQKNKLENIDNL